MKPHYERWTVTQIRCCVVNRSRKPRQRRQAPAFSAVLKGTLAEGNHSELGKQVLDFQNGSHPHSPNFKTIRHEKERE